MNALESQLANRLHGMADGDIDSTPPTQIVLGRGRQARRRRSLTMVAAASLAVVAVGGVAVSAAAHPWTPSRPGAVVPAQAQSPQLELAAAVSASQNVSYRVKVTMPLGDETTSGAFDPATATGYLNSTVTGSSSSYQERLINGVRFVGSSGSKTWKQYPGKHSSLSYDRNLDGAVGASTDPEQLFEALRQSVAKISQAGAGVYHFTTTVNTPASARGTLKFVFVGDVTLDADKRIAKVSYQRTADATKDGVALTSTEAVTVELSGYGTPVKVEKPTKVVVVK